MLDSLFLAVSTLAVILSSVVTWHVFTNEKHIGKLAFGALMLALLTYTGLEFANTLFLVSATEIPLLETFFSALTLVLLLMAHSKEVFS